MVDDAREERRRREEAEREAEFLAKHYPGGVFAVVECVAVHVVGEPEVKIAAAQRSAG